MEALKYHKAVLDLGHNHPNKRLKYLMSVVLVENYTVTLTQILLDQISITKQTGHR